jgi:hypothetical protein
MSHLGSARQHLGLALLSGAGLAYLVWVAGQSVPVGGPRLQGVVGLLLGLYLGSLPAAHAIDLLFVQRGAGRPGPLRRQAAWLGLNVLALVVSLAVITVGATRFAAAAPTTP